MTRRGRGDAPRKRALQGTAVGSEDMVGGGYMAVLLEAISVVVRKETLAAKFPGGVAGYRANAPNRTYCEDDFLTRVGFMHPDGVSRFIAALATQGLDPALEIAVVDMDVPLVWEHPWLALIEVFDPSVRGVPQGDRFGPIDQHARGLEAGCRVPSRFGLGHRIGDVRRRPARWS